MINIGGYDPRDLLYGHYLDFRIYWSWRKDKSKTAACNGAECCLCLEEQGNNLPPVVQAGACDVIEPACLHFVIERDDQSFFDYDHPAIVARDFWQNCSYQYFIPEDSAPELDDYLRDNKHKRSLDIRVTRSGKMKFDELYIDGKPWCEFLRAQPPKPAN